MRCLFDSIRFESILLDSNRSYYCIRAKRGENFWAYMGLPVWLISQAKRKLRAARIFFLRLPPQASPPGQNILYYLREPLGAKTRILSHTTSARLPATLPILLLTRDHGTTGPQDQDITSTGTTGPQTPGNHELRVRELGHPDLQT